MKQSHNIPKKYTIKIPNFNTFSSKIVLPFLVFFKVHGHWSHILTFFQVYTGICYDLVANFQNVASIRQPYRNVTKLSKKRRYSTSFGKYSQASKYKYLEFDLTCMPLFNFLFIF